MSGKKVNINDALLAKNTATESVGRVIGFDGDRAIVDFYACTSPGLSYHTEKAPGEWPLVGHFKTTGSGKAECTLICDVDPSVSGRDRCKSAKPVTPGIQPGQVSCGTVVAIPVSATVALWLIAGTLLIGIILKVTADFELLRAAVLRISGS